MTAQQKFSENKKEMSDQQRSILLVDIMNATGYSKSEREIHRHSIHLTSVLLNSFPPHDQVTVKITGNTLEGISGGLYSDHDIDILLTLINIKLFTPPTNNTKNIPLFSLRDYESYDAFFFVEEDDNFPGYVKLSLPKVRTKCAYLHCCTRMNNGKLYLSSSMMMDSVFMKTGEDSIIPIEMHPILETCLQINGPSHALYNKRYIGSGKQMDIVHCIHYDVWPNSANSFITRRKPNNWPSNSMIQNIQSQGCDVAPVGHHDGKNNDIQWRISFPGESSLLLDLNDVQILCYVLIKTIIKEIMNTSQREVVSSFQIKHVMFWCVESYSCQWVDSNYINCLNICLANLIQKIKSRYIPHYIIESRNLFNSKMTEKMSKEIVDVLSKYDTTHVFTLDAFEHVFEETHFNNALLKHEALQSTIMACFFAYESTFNTHICCTSSMWGVYIPHNAAQSLLNYVKILQNLKKVKGVAIHYATYFVRSMVGFLYYAKHKESNKMDVLLTSKRLIKKSLNLDCTCVLLRAATFYLTNMEYSQSTKICDTFLTFPRKQKLDSSYFMYAAYRNVNAFHQIFDGATTEEMENIIKAILPMFYCSVKLKYVHGNYDITQHNPAWIFRNFTNIFFHRLCMDVTFMTAEKWVVPDPILYELLSLPEHAENEVFQFSGINLDPMFVCIQTKFLCYHSMGNVNGMDEILALMNNFITEQKCTIQSSCVYLNMFAYCQIKARHNKQSAKYILQSLRIFSSKYNAASGYLKIVLQILNSLSVSNC